MSWAMIAWRLLIFRRRPFSGTITRSFSASCTKVDRFFASFGRPRGLPEQPGLNRVWRGGSGDGFEAARRALAAFSWCPILTEPIEQAWDEGHRHNPMAAHRRRFPP
jgi:hypothetical protein